MNKNTCGVAYREAIAEYGISPETYRAFAIGFMHGNAEKVCIGACYACMFRPSKEHLAWVIDAAKEIASRYDLWMTTLDSRQENRQVEVWLFQPGYSLGLWLEHPTNSPQWHRLRGEACGIKPEDIDALFHKRAGYGEKAD